MTIVVGAIVKPKGKRKSFFVIGSDTRKRSLVNGKMVLFDDQEKIYRFDNMYLGIAGALPEDFFNDLSEPIRNLDLTFELKCQWLQREVKKYLDDYDFLEGINYWRVRMILGGIERNVPKMAILEYDTRDGGIVECSQYTKETRGYHVDFIGNTRKTQTEQLKLRKQFSSVKNANDAKIMLRSFMDKTAEKYPLECNDSFQFKTIEGD